LDETRAGKFSRQNEVAKAMDYMLKRIDVFTRFLEDGRICLSNNAAERELRGIATHESLCNSFSSVCKHWKCVFVRSATRATLSGNRSFHCICRQIRRADLEGRAWHNLHGGKDIRLDQPSDGVVCHAERLGGIRQSPPFSADR
jgi:hypothetical protein